MRFAVVGNGKMAIDILKILNQTFGASVVLALGDTRKETPHSKLSVLCKGCGIEYLSSPTLDEPKILDALAKADLDYIVSVNNFLLFQGPALTCAKRGVVNFHNGPLPRYAGLNACSWALFNDERQHGVTWHFVDTGIDSGPILRQRCFEIAERETAIGLVVKCIREGVSLFRELLPELLNGQAVGTPQTFNNRLYYSGRDKPYHGYLPWWEGEASVRRLARAISFAPMPNLFFRPMIFWEGGHGFVEVVGLPETDAVPLGIIDTIDTKSMLIGLGDFSVRISDLYDENGISIDAKNIGPVEGEKLIHPVEGGKN